MIVAGYTRSPGFPVTHRFGTAEIISGAFITKIDSTGQKILFSTFIPGGTVHSLALDSQDNIYITGDCTDYFTITNAFQTEYKGGSSEAFVAKLSSDGSKLLYSSFLGGSGMDMARGIAVDSQGQAWITGWTSSTNFPTTSNAIQPLFGGKYDAFVAKVSNTGKVLVYSSFLGGEKADASSAVALDNDGNVYLGGWTCSTNFLNQTVPLILGSGGWQNGMVVKMNASGTAIQYLTLLGGTDRQSLVAAIAVDNLGQAYLFGETDATNFPVSTQCWQDQNRGGFDNFIMKLNRQGSGIIYSTYLGGDDDDYASMYEYVGEDRIALGKAGIAIDSEGSAYVTARTSSRSFVPSGIAGNIFSGYYDGYAAKVNSDGSRLERFLYLGNSHWDAAFGLALDRMGRVLVTGSISPGPIPPFSR